MQANGVNYYKGVLLCSRPNESPSVQREKPFCGRVYPSQQLGLVPTKQYGERKTRKRHLPVLDNHKKWLEKFKLGIEEKKTQEIQEEKRKQELLDKIRQQGREKVRQVVTGSVGIADNSSVQRQLQKSTSQGPQKATKNAHKKKPKQPAWAQTQQQAQEHQQQQVDELLDFFGKGQTQEVKDYVKDEDIKKILTELKGKIEVLKQQGDEWRQKELIRIEDQNNKGEGNQQRGRQRNNNSNDKDDILSRISKQSGSQSVTSQKTVDRVEQLEKKKEAKQWDKLTTSGKSSLASVDDQIAKHIADEILRNYPNMKHHSNQSIRKLLYKQAKQELKAK